jgi:ribosomal-protein-alanine N-acetyltransferase
LNWLIREQRGAPLGYVQATIEPTRTAWVAYVLGSAHWGRGYAREATQQMLGHLASEYGVTRYHASVEVENRRSIRLLKALGFREATRREATVMS